MQGLVPSRKQPTEMEVNQDCSPGGVGAATVFTDWCRSLSTTEEGSNMTTGGESSKTDASHLGFLQIKWRKTLFYQASC